MYVRFLHIHVYITSLSLSLSSPPPPTCQDFYAVFTYIFFILQILFSLPNTLSEIDDAIHENKTKAEVLVNPGEDVHEVSCREKRDYKI